MDRISTHFQSTESIVPSLVVADDLAQARKDMKHMMYGLNAQSNDIDLRLATVTDSLVVFEQDSASDHPLEPEAQSLREYCIQENPEAHTTDRGSVPTID